MSKTETSQKFFSAQHLLSVVSLAVGLSFHFSAGSVLADESREPGLLLEHGIAPAQTPVLAQTVASGAPTVNQTPPGKTLTPVNPVPTFVPDQPQSADANTAPLRPPLPDPQPELNFIRDTVVKAEESEGSMFITPDEVAVKTPLLKALVQLHNDLSPYQLDATRSRPVSLRDILQQALGQNLTIKISQADLETSKWIFRSSLGNFLPTLTNQLSYQRISGNYASPFGLLASVNSPYLTVPNGLTWTFFSGGLNYYTAKQTLHKSRSAKFLTAATTNDIIMEATRLYYQLLQQDIVLHIRIKAVETSQALVDQNSIQLANGACTKLSLLQAQSQLARDRQALIAQQVTRRKAAVELSTLLNADSAEDLILKERVIKKVRLVAGNLKVSDLLSIAIDNRPELKRWEQERLAAKDAIRIAFAPLLPQLIGTAGAATTGARVSSVSSSAGASSASTGSFGIGGFSTGTLAATGGNGNQPKRFNAGEIFTLGLTLQWNIGGMGLTDAAKIEAARWQSRKAQSEFARELTYVSRQVKDAYLDSINAENQIIATTDSINASRAQLEVATIRLKEGVGTDLEIVIAQRDYTEALIAKACAIVDFNQAQARLLRALGKISVATVVSGTQLSR